MANTVIIANAGSGKTTRLVSEAHALEDARILITTYTNENTDNIRECIIKRLGYVPVNVTIATWFSVLLTHGVKPYQNLVATVPLARSPMLADMPDGLRFVPKVQVDRYYFTRSGHPYRDRISDFVCHVDDQTGGRVIRRLEGIFTHIFIDELQDLAGYDLSLLEKLFRSNIETMAVGDPRQATFATNNSAKNKAVAKAAIVDWIAAKQKEGLIDVEERTESWRSNQVICDFADALYPHMPRSTSRNEEVTGHDGIFHIAANDVAKYVATHDPVVLRWNKASKTMGLPAINFGASKGRTFDRVLIFPTKPMVAYLQKGDLAVAGDVPKFYVAVTRARYSVAFVV